MSEENIKVESGSKPPTEVKLTGEQSEQLSRSKKVVFIQIVDGTADDYSALRQVIAPVLKTAPIYHFIIVPSKVQLKSLSIDELEKLIKR